GTPLFTSTITVSGNGNYTSGSYTPLGAGHYTWQVFYSGDANNNQFTAPCDPQPEEFIVTPASPAVSTSVTNANLTLASNLSTAYDTATLTGGFGTPTGSITFNVFQSSSVCTGTIVFTSTVQVNGNGQYNSASFTPAQAGTYLWQASYSGDANNNPYTAACGANGETLTALPAWPTITTKVSPSSITSAGSATDTATLAGGSNPTGTITFAVFSQNATCTGTPVFTSTVIVNGNGNYQSAPFTTPSVGVYNWLASYSGDTNNNPYTAPCGASGETLTVIKATPNITTLATPSSITLTTVSGWAGDTGTLSNGSNPTGSIVFALYTANQTCTGAPLYASNVTVTGN